MALNFQQARELLQRFQFSDLFIEQLGWSFPPTEKAVAMEVDGKTYYRQMIAELSGVVVFEITAVDGQIPSAKTRAAIYKETAELVLEALLIFLDRDRTQSLWYWIKREGTKYYSREHLYVKGQPGDLFLDFLGTFSSLTVDLSELEDGLLSVVEVAQQLESGLDVELVTKKFFKEFQNQLEAFVPLIQGIDTAAERRSYAVVILNRLIFVYFLQAKGFLNNGDTRYFQKKLKQSKDRGSDRFYSEFLKTLFFEGFAKPSNQRSSETQALIGDIKYLNGSLFLKHKIEQTYTNISIPDRAFDNILNLFVCYSWNLDDTPSGQDNEINPSVLGYIFEKYINQKSFGAYSTPPEITEYLGERTISKLIFDRINRSIAPRKFESITELLTRLDADLCRRLLQDILRKLSILDPACGSGAFLVTAMKILLSIYSVVIGKIEFLNDYELKKWLQKERTSHPSLSYFIKKRIITDNLYGVDIMEEATQIAKLRLFLALVSSIENVDDGLEPLANIDFNIMVGNSLIGLIRVDEEDFDALGKLGAVQGHLLDPLAYQIYEDIFSDKEQSIAEYKKQAFLQTEKEELTQKFNLLQLRNHIEKLNQEAQNKLNLLLLNEFNIKLGIRYEEAQLRGKPKKRLLTSEDIAVLEPFHWGYHFAQVLERGGFDAIITNPPWETFRPNAKEFFAQYSDLVKKNKMALKDFEEEQKKLLKNPEIAAAWLEYQSQFPHVSAYYRLSKQYENQSSIVNGKKAGTDINLYKLFIEQCFNLLCPGGRCGIIVPTGIYTDLGTKQLREMLFSRTEIDTLLGMSNERYLLGDVHHHFKFCLLTLKKGGFTNSFKAAFRIDPREAVSPRQLDAFLNNEAEQVKISVPLIRRLSPDSLSVKEFKSKIDIHIAEKLLKFPLLGEKIEGKWNLRLTREFDMTNDRRLFNQKPGDGRLPLYEGKMIHQFTHLNAEPRYWVDEQEGRKALLRRNETDKGQKLDYQSYRLGFRAVARNTDTRTLIVGTIPKNTFCGNSILVSSPKDTLGQKISNTEILVAQAILNSFTVDFYIRQMVSANINMFYIYQLPMPRLGVSDLFFNEIVQRAVKLICTTPEFDDFAQEVGLGSHQQSVINEVERQKIRAEIDGMIAHIYEISEEEFSYILNTFTRVPNFVKLAALNAYRDVERGLLK